MIIHGCWKWGSTPIESKLNLILSLQNLGSKGLQISATKNLAHPTEKGFWDFFKLPFFLQAFILVPGVWWEVRKPRIRKIFQPAFMSFDLPLQSLFINCHCFVWYWSHFHRKFGIVKGVVFLSFWQSVLVSILIKFHIINGISTWSPDEVHDALAFWLTGFSGKIFLHYLSTLCNFGK